MEKLQSQGAYKVKLENPLEAWPTTRLSVDINYKGRCLPSQSSEQKCTS